MAQPFNQMMDWAEWLGVMEPCPHKGGVDEDGYCLTCDFPAKDAD